MRGKLKFFLRLLLRFPEQSRIKFRHGLLLSFLRFLYFFGFDFNDGFKNLFVLVLNKVTDNLLTKDQLKTSKRQLEKIYPFGIQYIFIGTVRSLLGLKIFHGFIPKFPEPVFIIESYLW